jgi:hypothetical protein
MQGVRNGRANLLFKNKKLERLYMGISISGLEQLLFLKQNYESSLNGRVLQLGKQDINFNVDTLISYANEYNVKLAPPRD